MGRRGVLVVLGVVLLTAVAGVGARLSVTGPAGPGADDDGSHRSAVEATLSLMTDGIRRHDENRFLSAVDPRRTAVVARQRAVFRALASLPLQAPEYVWPDDATGQAGADGSVTVAVGFRYAFLGWDTSPALDPVTFTFAEAGGKWLVADDTVQAEDAVHGRFLEPWMTGTALAVERSAHVLVIGDGAHRADLSRLATRVEQVVGEVRRVWPEPSWNGKVIAYASDDERFLAEWFDSAPAATVGGADDTVSSLAVQGNLPAEGGPGAGPSRLAVSPYLLQQSEKEALPTLQHEVTHVAVSHLGRPVPFWMTEGVAEYTSYLTGEEEPDVARMLRGHTWSQGLDLVKEGTWEPGLVLDADALPSTTGYEVDDAYFDAWIASLYIAQQYGETELRELYRVASHQPESATLEQVEAAALEVLDPDLDHDTLTEAVQEYGNGLAAQVP